MATESTEAKRTKRVRHSDEAMSLEDHIARKRTELVAARLEVPALHRKARDLRARADAMSGKRWCVRGALDMESQAQEIEGEAKMRESMVREHDYERLVVSYLRMYHKRIENAPKAVKKSDTIEAYVRQSDLNVQRRATILDEYLVDMNQAPPKVAMAARDECVACNVKLLLCASKSLLTCPQCGQSVTYLDATSTSTSFDEEIQYSQFSYKRVNHWTMWLAHCQGKEAHEVPKDIMDTVMHELYNQNITDAKDVTQKHVRSILRRLKLRRAYDHVAQITSRISGIRPLRIPPDTEETLKQMFLQMQPAFERHAPKSRKNFLSYSYVLFRCFQILNLTHMLDGLSLLKGKDKLALNDAIFTKMAADLGWTLPKLDVVP